MFHIILTNAETGTTKISWRFQRPFLNNMKHRNVDLVRVFSTNLNESLQAIFSSWDDTFSNKLKFVRKLKQKKRKNWLNSCNNRLQFICMPVTGLQLCSKWYILPRSETDVLLTNRRQMFLFGNMRRLKNVQTAILSKFCVWVLAKTVKLCIQQRVTLTIYDEASI